jgi:RNA 2',3'-cyclic 3'-phosphodiesterase
MILIWNKKKFRSCTLFVVKYCFKEVNDLFISIEDIMSTFRGFIAIDIKTTPQIIMFEKEITKTGADVKLVEPENIHITVKFLGDTDETYIDVIEQSIKESVLSIKPFLITLEGTGVFPNQNYIKVIWIGITDNGNIETIARAIDEKLKPLGFKKESRGFSPHLTVGRVKTAINKDQLLKVIGNYNTVEFTIQNIQSITLKKSELTPNGPIYTTLREVLL